MARIALFPGSFDPYTLGHHDVVLRTLDLFDKIIIGIGKNSTKEKAFSADSVKQKLTELYKNIPKIEVEIYQKLTVEFAREKDAKYILRGIRNGTDLDYEKSIAQTNKMIAEEIETLFIVTSSQYSMMNSSIVREIYKAGGDISSFLPYSI